MSGRLVFFLGFLCSFPPPAPGPDSPSPPLTFWLIETSGESPNRQEKKEIRMVPKPWFSDTNKLGE